MSKSILPYLLSLSLVVPSVAFAVRHDDAPDRATHAAKPRSAKPMSEKEIQKKAAQAIKKVMADEKKKANAALKKLAADEKKSATARKKAEAEEKKALTLSQKKVERAKRELNTAEKKLDGARKNALKERDKGIVNIEKINKEYPGLDLTGANPKRLATLHKQLERHQEIIRNAYEKLAHFAAKVDTLKTNFKTVSDSHQVLKDQLDAAAKARATAAADEKVAVAKAKADIENAAKTAIANAEASANKLADDLRAGEMRAAAAAVKAKEEADAKKAEADAVKQAEDQAKAAAKKAAEDKKKADAEIAAIRKGLNGKNKTPFERALEEAFNAELQGKSKADQDALIYQVKNAFADYSRSKGTTPLETEAAILKFFDALPPQLASVVKAKEAEIKNLEAKAATEKAEALKAQAEAAQKVETERQAEVELAKALAAKAKAEQELAASRAAQAAAKANLPKTWSPTTVEEGSQIEKIFNSGDINAFRQLMASGIDPNSQIGSRLQTLLVVAIQKGNDPKVKAQIVKELLAAGANPNGSEDSGYYRPVYWAAYEGNLEIFKALKEAGANMLVKNMYGQTPLDIVRNSWSQGENSKIVDYLLTLPEFQGK